jgi:hypothetical protein
VLVLGTRGYSVTAYLLWGQLPAACFALQVATCAPFQPRIRASDSRATVTA